MVVIPDPVSFSAEEPSCGTFKGRSPLLLKKPYKELKKWHIPATFMCYALRNEE